MLKNVGKAHGFEILGQTGVPPVTYPDLANPGLGWPELILPSARAARPQKSFRFDRESFLRAANRARAWAKSVLASPA